jgi:hypothetical protein
MKRWLAFAGSTVVCVCSVTSATSAQVRIDLADQVAGQYMGDVISDARGSSPADVTITVTKSAPNMVTVQSDYPRIPIRTFRLTRAMDTIQNASGSEVFLAEMNKAPVSLMLTIDDASWAGVKTGVSAP